MTPRELLNEIGRLGDDFVSRKRLSRVDGDGDYIRFEPEKQGDYPAWSFIDMACRAMGGEIASWKQWLGLVLAVCLLGPPDLVQIAARAIVYPLFLGCWYLERAVFRLRKRTYFCPACFNPMDAPLVYCPNCERVQPLLRPTFGSLVFWTCANPRCRRRHKWIHFGQFLFYRPKPLVCRDTLAYRGCYRPHRLASLAGKCCSTHVAIVGVAVQPKHALMAHLFCNLTAVGSRKYRYQAYGKLSQRELELCNSVLFKAFSQDTQACETPGRDYTLAKSFLLKAVNKKRLLVFHNVAARCTTSEQGLICNLPNPALKPKLVFVLDPGILDADTDRRIGSHAEVFSRVVRRIQHDFDLPPVARLPIRMAVVLPLPRFSGHVQHLHRSGEMTRESITRLVLNKDPAFDAIVREMISPSKLEYFGGIIPDTLTPSRFSWISKLAEWAT